MKSNVRIFLSYARADEERVTQVYQKLLAEGFTPWMDTQDILLGEKWEHSINQAIRRADFFLVFLSNGSTNKRGFLRKEINAALEIWKEKLQGDIYLIPLRLDDCPVPEDLSNFQYGDLFRADGWPLLLRAIRLGVERMSLTEQLNEAVKVSEKYVTSQRKSEVIRQPTTAPSLEMLTGTLFEMENYINPNERLNFEHQVTQMLSRFIDKLGKETKAAGSSQWTEHAPKWREVRSKIEVLSRRIELLQSPNRQDFQSTLMWMAERGTEEDLELLLQIERDPPFHTEDIRSLIKIAKERINTRLGH